MSGDWDALLWRCLLDALMGGGALDWWMHHLCFFAYLMSWFEDDFVPSLLLVLRVCEAADAGRLVDERYFRWWDVW